MNVIDSNDVERDASGKPVPTFPHRALGILAYGSLIDDPGREIATATAEILCRGILTPFPVEFARSSRTRAGAPTLVPVAIGGSYVPARVFVLRNEISEREARNMLWRRETGHQGNAPTLAGTPSQNDVIIDHLMDFHGVAMLLYVRIAPNIEPLTAHHLAELAVGSAQCAGVARAGRDGISYLAAALRNGTRTRLSEAYESEVLRQTGTATLCDALARARHTALHS